MPGILHFDGYIASIVRASAVDLGEGRSGNRTMREKFDEISFPASAPNSRHGRPASTSARGPCWDLVLEAGSTPEMYSGGATSARLRNELTGLDHQAFHPRWESR